METEIVNPTEVTNYFNDIIEESLGCGTPSFSKSDYDPEAPEFYFTQLWFSMGLSMARRTKVLFENVRNKKCEKCLEMDTKFEQINCELSHMTKSYNLLLSFVKTCDPLLSQKFLASNQPVSIPCSPKGGANVVCRSPLTPVKPSNNINIMRDQEKDSPSKYFSPTQQNIKLDRQNRSTIVGIGNPLHSSTQVCLNLQFDENMKIKNSQTPNKKKKKEISPLKSPPSNVCIMSQVFAGHKLGTQIHNDSCDSIEILPETPPDFGAGQKQKFKNEGKKKKSTVPKFEVLEDIDSGEGDDCLTPVIPRASTTMKEGMQHVKTPEQNVKYEEFGVSPSIMSDRIPARNLNDSFGTLEPEETISKGFPRNSRPTSHLNTTDVLHATPPTKVESTRKPRSNWVSTESKKLGNKSSSSSSSSSSISSSTHFKSPLSKGKRMKQMTLLQMKKKATKNEDINVDISTLKEFDGGTRPMQNSLKRKSDEKLKNENSADPRNKKCVISGKAHYNSDETAFEESSFQEFQDAPKPSSSKVCKRGINQLNATAELLDNLDRLPNRQSQEPAFAYKPERAIRKKEERAKLTGFACEDCDKYYEAMGSDPDFVQNLKNKCSRHRAKHPVNLAGTPPGYWATGFPSTEEQKRTGLFRTDSCLESDDDEN